MTRKNVWEIFSTECPKVAEAYLGLSKELNIDGVLDEKTIALIKVSNFSLSRDPVALRHFIQVAFQAGASKQEIEAAALIPFGTGVTFGELSIPLILDVAEELGK